MRNLLAICVSAVAIESGFSTKHHIWLKSSTLEPLQCAQSWFWPQTDGTSLLYYTIIVTKLSSTLKASLCIILCSQNWLWLCSLISDHHNKTSPHLPPPKLVIAICSCVVAWSDKITVPICRRLAGIFFFFHLCDDLLQTCNRQCKFHFFSYPLSIGFGTYWLLPPLARFFSLSLTVIWVLFTCCLYKFLLLFLKCSSIFMYKFYLRLDIDWIWKIKKKSYCVYPHIVYWSSWYFFHVIISCRKHYEGHFKSVICFSFKS